MNHYHSQTILNIDLGAIAENYKIIQKHIGEKVEIAAVIKADAYGIGAVEVVKKLSSRGCSKFFVMTIDEAIAIRDYSLTDEIYVLGGIRKGDENYFYLHNIIPVLNSVEEVNLWFKFAKRKNVKFPAIIYLDTGMNRMGLTIAEVKSLFDNKIEENIKICYIMSHLSCAEEVNNEFNHIQLEKFKEVEKFTPHIPKTLVSTPGIFLGSEYHFNLVRPGAALYGLRTSLNVPKLKQVLSLRSALCFIRKCTEDGYCGYGNSYKVKKNMVIGVVPFGYADGMPRSASNRGYCYIADEKVQIIGRVSMDSFMVDISDLSEKDAYLGAEVEIIGDNCSIEDVANYCGTVNHEILISLTKGRFKKEYFRGVGDKITCID